MRVQNFAILGQISNISTHKNSHLKVIQDSSILELVEIAMYAFNSHALQEVDAFLSRATCSDTNNHMREHCPIIERIDTTSAHAYLDTAISV